MVSLSAFILGSAMYRRNYAAVSDISKIMNFQKKKKERKKTHTHTFCMFSHMHIVL